MYTIVFLLAKVHTNTIHLVKIVLSPHPRTKDLLVVQLLWAIQHGPKSEKVKINLTNFLDMI